MAKRSKAMTYKEMYVRIGEIEDILIHKDKEHDELRDQIDVLSDKLRELKHERLDLENEKNQLLKDL